MNPKKTPAVVIKTYPYSETSLIVSLFTAREGLITVLAKGATRKNNKFGADLNALHIGEYIYTKPKNSELGTLIESDTLYFPKNILQNSYKFFAASYITDILRNFLFLPEDNFEVFKLAYACTLQIEKAKTEPEISLAVLSFEIKIFIISGILVNLDSCPACESTDFDHMLINKEQHIICTQCKKTNEREISKITKKMINVINTIAETSQKKIPSTLKEQTVDYRHISHSLRNLLDFALQKQLKSLSFES